MRRVKLQPIAMRSMHVVFIAVTTLVHGLPCDAQRQPATIPTALAEAMTLWFGSPVLGTPVYTVNGTPPGWPKELVPARARVIGGGMLGNANEFRIRTLVVEMPAGRDPANAVNALAATAGYGTGAAAADTAQGGFLESASVPKQMPLCKGKTSMFAFGVIDSIRAPRILVLQYYDGEVARQNCDAAERSRVRFGNSAHFGPSNMPGLVAPSGVASTPVGMNWSGSEGTTGARLRTSMPIDSLLAHYTRQLAAAGWEVVGSALTNADIGLQKFRFKDGEEPWSARLMIEVVGNRRDVSLRLAAVNSEY